MEEIKRTRVNTVIWTQGMSMSVLNKMTIHQMFVEDRPKLQEQTSSSL